MLFTFKTLLRKYLMYLFVSVQAVKLESVHSGRTRYLAVVSKQGRQMTEESCLLGIDCNHNTTVGLVLKVLADTYITLDGDG
jgi:protein phosphatase slingshot